MNATKLYIIGRCLTMISLVVGITLCTIHFNNLHLMWWYLLPALLGEMEVKSTSKGDSDGE